MRKFPALKRPIKLKKPVFKIDLNFRKYLSYIAKHKKMSSGIALALAVALIFYAIYSPGIVGASATKRLLPIYCVQRDNKAVSLTFDAAWGNEDTQHLIDILAKYNVKATFFVVGAWVDKYPESVKALFDAGHEVMSHSDDHAHFASLTADQIRKNVGTSCDKIEAVTGIRPTLFRAPYGEYDDNVIATLDGMGMHTIQWDVELLECASSDCNQGVS